MANLTLKVQAESENVSESLAHLMSVLERTAIGTVELAAIGTFVHNIYNGIENILQQILKDQNIAIPSCSSWHKELLEVSRDNNIISAALTVQLAEYLSFRHYFVHSYSFMLKAELLLPLAQGADAVWEKFSQGITRFI